MTWNPKLSLRQTVLILAVFLVVWGIACACLSAWWPRDDGTIRCRSSLKQLGKSALLYFEEHGDCWLHTGAPAEKTQKDGE